MALRHVGTESRFVPADHVYLIEAQLVTRYGGDESSVEFFESYVGMSY